MYTKNPTIQGIVALWGEIGNYNIPASDSDFCAILLARLIKQPREFFSAMPAKDYAKLTQEVINFLLV